MVRVNCPQYLKPADSEDNSVKWRHSYRSESLTPRVSRWSESVHEVFLEKNVDWTTAERRSAAYFQEVSIYKILSLQRDKDFWKGIVPCLAEVNTGIRHLVVAIAATHELLLQPNSTSLNQFALMQCNKALQSILSFSDTSISILLTSCVLVAAYNLLRGDIEAADKSVESGLRMSFSAQIVGTNSDLDQVCQILTSLGKQHGFKLWAPDITFKFDRTLAGRENLTLDTRYFRGPFVDAQQVLTTFKSVMVESIAKPLRNLSLGAHIEPDCSLAKDIRRNFSDIFFHWETYYRSLPDAQADQRLGLIQLKVGLISARVLFETKIVESNEVRDNEYIRQYGEIAELGAEIIAARHAGRPVIYLDRIVNGALYTSSLFCRDPIIKRRLISLLKSQVIYTDGLVNFLRGHIGELVGQIEEYGIIVKHCYEVPENRRVRVSHLSCQAGRTLRVQYMLASQTDRQTPKEHRSLLPPEVSRFSTEDVDDCLKGMTAAYTMYRKVDLPDAPCGYLREMYYGGRPVPVTWRADLLEKYSADKS